METITIHRRSKEEAKAFEQMAIAQKISFENSSKYNPKFVKKIKRGEAEKKAGHYKMIKTEDLWK